MPKDVSLNKFVYEFEIVLTSKCIVICAFWSALLTLQLSVQTNGTNDELI